MQLNQPVQNPAFISKLKQFDTNKTRKDELELIEEMRKMHYITPVTLDPSPEEGKPNQQTQVKFRAATTTKGESFFAMFSDMDELKKWAPDTKDAMTLDFTELRTLVLGQKGQVAGFVVNPASQNLVIRTNTMEQIANPLQQRPISPDMVVLSKPDPYPKELVQTLCEYFKTRTEVLSAWLFTANYKTNMNEPHHLVIVSLTQGVNHQELFKATVDACHKAMKAGEFLDLMPSSGKFGKQAIEDKKPLYRKGIDVELED